MPAAWVSIAARAPGLQACVTAISVKQHEEEGHSHRDSRPHQEFRVLGLGIHAKAPAPAPAAADQPRPTWSRLEPGGRRPTAGAGPQARRLPHARVERHYVARGAVRPPAHGLRSRGRRAASARAACHPGIASVWGGGGGGGADWRPGVGGSLAPLCRGSAGSRESGGVVGGGPGCGRAGAPAGRATWLGARGGAPCRSAGAGTQGWAVLDRWLVVVWATIRLRLGLSTFICLLPVVYYVL